MSSVLRQYNFDVAYIRPSVGEVKTSTYSNDHWGWLKCDGRELEIGDFQFLQDMIGTSFGGSGTKFALPDAKGRVEGVIGSGDSLTIRAMGDAVGAETHTLSIAEMPAHTHTGTTSTDGLHAHTITDDGHAHSFDIDGLNNGNFTGENNQQPAADANAGSNGVESNTTTTNSASTGIIINSNGAHTHTFTTSSTGGDEPHNNMQPTLFIGNMFIYSGRPTYGFKPY